MPGMGGAPPPTPAGFYSDLLAMVALGLGIAALALVAVAVRHAYRPAQHTPGPPAQAGATSLSLGAQQDLPARRLLRRGLGLLWVLDGLLQAQPAMPSRFASQILQPLASSQPNWLANVLHWEIYLWQVRPIIADSATVLLQAGLGLAILGGGDSRLGRVALWCSIAWAGVVWVGGEAMGGLFSSGATQLMGAPGAVLAYAAIAGLLLAPASLWVEGRAQRLVTGGVGAMLILGGLLQAIPQEGFWNAKDLSSMFAAMASTPQPRLLSAPIAAVAHATARHPLLWNAALAATMLVIGIGLAAGRRRRTWGVAAVAWFAATWWIGQDFGIMGGTGTDPNLSPVVVLLLLSAELRGARETGDAVLQSERASRQTPEPLRSGLRLLLAVVGMGEVGLGAFSAAAVVPYAASQASTAAAVVSGGAVLAASGQKMPNVVLTNQDGRSVSLRAWRGKVVVLTFLDPVCYDACPMIAAQIRMAEKELGPLAARTEFVAIDANPRFLSVAAIRAFDQEQGLAGLRNWQFLTGPLPRLQKVWADFNVTVEVARFGMVGHSQLLYFVGPNGKQATMVGDSALSQSGVTSAYAALVTNQVRALALR